MSQLCKFSLRLTSLKITTITTKTQLNYCWISQLTGSLTCWVVDGIYLGRSTISATGLYGWSVRFRNGATWIMAIPTQSPMWKISYLCVSLAGELCVSTCPTQGSPLWCCPSLEICREDCWLARKQKCFIRYHLLLFIACPYCKVSYFISPTLL